MDISQTKTDEIYAVFKNSGKQHTAHHSKMVCEKALSLCGDADMAPKIELACALHDISVIIPKERWIQECAKMGIELISQEIEVPLLVHQKLSAAIARDRFKVSEHEILSAISCHTTLKPDPSYLDLLLFTADKIAWDGAEIPPWEYAINDGLSHSLYHAAFNYISYIIDHGLIILPHPKLLLAHQWLSQKIS